jgi:hypothetical protein
MRSPTSLHLWKTRLSDSVIQVGFYRTQVQVRGKRLVDRIVDQWRTPGLWGHIFAGQVEVDCETLLLRVMKALKVFVLRQRIG